MVFLNIGMFLLFQVVANVLFKWGSTAPHLYWWGFGLGNLIGVSSILFMIGMYRDLPAANVIAIGTGGTFILNQLVMFLLYREKLNTWAVIGIVMIFAGILIAATMNTPKKPADEKIQAENSRQIHAPETVSGKK